MLDSQVRSRPKRFGRCRVEKSLPNNFRWLVLLEKCLQGPLGASHGHRRQWSVPDWSEAPQTPNGGGRNGTEAVDHAGDSGQHRAEEEHRTKDKNATGTERTTSSDAEAMCPTDGKIRQMRRKELGHEPKKRKFEVGDHQDDCGTSVKGSGIDDKDMWIACEDACEDALDSGYEEQNQTTAYPTTGIQADANDAPQPGDEPERPEQCKACKGRYVATDPRHNRIACQCRYPLVEPQEWACPGCKHSEFRRRAPYVHTRRVP